MNASDNEIRASKIISETLQLVNHASLDPRILYKVPLKVSIGRSGFGPEIMVEFLGAYFAKKTIQAEFGLYLGNDTEVAGNIDICHIDDQNNLIGEIEHINPSSMKEVADYFEKVMTMYAELEDKK
jgi:hypothetical protein